MAATTSLSLITQIGDSENSKSWDDFVRLYGPFVYSIGRRHGLQDADACDLVQDVMREISRSMEKFEYDPHIGRFRGWLAVITRRTLARYFERSRHQISGVGGTTNVLALSDYSDDYDEDIWEQEHQRQMFRWAAQRVRGDFSETTWRAFWMTTVEGLNAQQASEACGISIGAVYIAKSRVVSRLREKTAEGRELCRE
ncbi:MAG: sigma-70 family RNA polymerase sigma factor [Planctomycetota bacterium]